jgi:uncharacterized membrane protein
MTAQREPETITQATTEEKRSSHRPGHGWMMIACCIPMLVIAVVLVATGVASPGFLVIAIGCTVMMAIMMAGMGHGSDHRV